MIRIGVVNIDTSHPLAFSNYLNTGKRAHYAGVYNDGFRGDDEVKAFMQLNGIKHRAQSIEELADSVDIGFIQSCNWDKHLTHMLPFIERGKPVFVDKPIVGNLADCRRIEELTVKGAKILGSSSIRYATEIADFLAKPIEERGNIVNVFGTTGVDEFNYGIHIVETIGGLLGTGAVSTQFVGTGSFDEKICETYYVRFANGVTAVYNTFQGVWHPFEVVMMTTKSTFQFRIDTGSAYAALLDRICDYMEGKKEAIAPVMSLTESVKIMLAARLSRSHGGEVVHLHDIPIDDPGYDGNTFEDEYARNAAKLYKPIPQTV